MSLGPVMLDVAGTELTDADTQRLQHPQVGGIILFSRNYDNPDQLKQLVQNIHQLRHPRLIVAVDQEGGRVQRFRDGFQKLPAMGLLGDEYDRDAERALKLSETVGWIMASELLYYGIDLSFAPVLDLGHKISSVIGDRAYHTDPHVIAHLANAQIRGMRRAGMQAVGKHFPGHGSVEGDSHHVMPFDRRSFATIKSHDLEAFRLVINNNLGGMMMAHVIYQQVDDKPAGYSALWISDVLRQQMRFEGTVFSDDLSMKGAELQGGYPARARACLDAGCDMILVCNNPSGADEILQALEDYNNPVSQLRLVRMHGHAGDKHKLFTSRDWQQAVEALQHFIKQTEWVESDDLFDNSQNQLV